MDFRQRRKRIAQRTEVWEKSPELGITAGSRREVGAWVQGGSLEETLVLVPDLDFFPQWLLQTGDKVTILVMELAVGTDSRAALDQEFAYQSPLGCRKLGKALSLAWPNID